MSTWGQETQIAAPLFSFSLADPQNGFQKLHNLVCLEGHKIVNVLKNSVTHTEGKTIFFPLVNHTFLFCLQNYLAFYGFHHVS